MKYFTKLSYFLLLLLMSGGGWTASCDGLSVKSGPDKLFACVQSLEVNMNDVQIPAGAVIAFDLHKCPKGWDEYRNAYGRFIRGVDRGIPKVDPDGERSIGNIQKDRLQEHTHRVTDKVVQSVEFKKQEGGIYAPAIGKNATINNYPNSSKVLDARKGSETRPVNVALLFCVKRK